MSPKTKKRIKYTALGLAALFILAQIVPYGCDHANPPVVREPPWDQSTRELARRSCFNCHSNETVWPWYSHAAPVSWLIQSDVKEARRLLNFSDYQGALPADMIKTDVADGDMPPLYYRLFHPSAKLTPAEKDTLIRGVEAVK